MLLLWGYLRLAHEHGQRPLVCGVLLQQVDNVGVSDAATVAPIQFQ
jgi:hypothetical protein